MRKHETISTKKFAFLILQRKKFAKLCGQKKFVFWHILHHKRWSITKAEFKITNYVILIMSTFQWGFFNLFFHENYCLLKDVNQRKSSLSCFHLCSTEIKACFINLPNITDKTDLIKKIFLIAHLLQNTQTDEKIFRKVTNRNSHKGCSIYSNLRWGFQ